MVTSLYGARALITISIIFYFRTYYADKIYEMTKITELIKRSGQRTFSFEVTPDLPETELDNLPIKPLFYSVTWHAKSHRNQNLDIGPLRIAKYLRDKGLEVVLHLSCDLLRKDFLKQILVYLQEIEILNLFVVLGGAYLVIDIFFI